MGDPVSSYLGSLQTAIRQEKGSHLRQLLSLSCPQAYAIGMENPQQRNQKLQGVFARGMQGMNFGNEWIEFTSHHLD